MNTYQINWMFALMYTREIFLDADSKESALEMAAAHLWQVHQYPACVIYNIQVVNPTT